MNNDGARNQDEYRSLLLMTELEEGQPISQREIAGRLGIALGLVNAYLKSLVQKGFVTVKAYPRNRYAYLLTPRGFTEKSRLAFQHLGNFNRLYRVTRRDSLALFVRLRERGVREVSFCGLDELTEIFYLSLQEAGLELQTVMDSDATEKRFLDRPVVGLADGVRASRGPIVLSSMQRAEALRGELLRLGVAAERICGPVLSFAEILGGRPAAGGGHG